MRINNFLDTKRKPVKLTVQNSLPFIIEEVDGKPVDSKILGKFLFVLHEKYSQNIAFLDEFIGLETVYLANTDREKMTWFDIKSLLRESIKKIMNWLYICWDLNQTQNIALREIDELYYDCYFLLKEKTKVNNFLLGSYTSSHYETDYLKENEKDIIDLILDISQTMYMKCENSKKHKFFTICLNSSDCDELDISILTQSNKNIWGDQLLEKTIWHKAYDTNIKMI